MVRDQHQAHKGLLQLRRAATVPVEPEPGLEEGLPSGPEPVVEALDPDRVSSVLRADVETCRRGRVGAAAPYEPAPGRAPTRVRAVGAGRGPAGRGSGVGQGGGGR